MTPKEKAIELVALMKWEGEGAEEKCYQDFAKDCALIAVDEIIKSQKCCYECREEGPIEMKYWHEVKAEIKNYISDGNF
jgi:hypothetical protein